MQKFDTPKKPVGDWPSHYIVYQLREHGLSFRKLARLHGYGPGSASTAIHIPWPKMERLIADAIGVTPQEIWPSRYRNDGTPKSKRNERGLGRYKPKNTTLTSEDAVEITRVDGHEAHAR